MNGNFISFEQAAEMTARFVANQDTILEEQYKKKGILYRNETFDRVWFDGLLGQEKAAGLRFYNGMDENLETRLIAVAVDSEGNDIVSGGAKSAALAASSGLIAEEGQRCPTNCPGGTAL